jgi:hypothetical protein
MKLAPSTKDINKMDNVKVLGNSFIRMEDIMKVNGKTTKWTDGVSYITKEES